MLTFAEPSVLQSFVTSRSLQGKAAASQHKANTLGALASAAVSIDTSTVKVRGDIVLPPCICECYCMSH
jgi:hypothetical protein